MKEFGKREKCILHSSLDDYRKATNLDNTTSNIPHVYKMEDGIHFYIKNYQKSQIYHQNHNEYAH